MGTPASRLKLHSGSPVALVTRPVMATLWLPARKIRPTTCQRAKSC
jgi:hypothetical protein